MIDLIGIQMDRDMNVRLQKLARHHNCTVDDLIVEAVNEYYADEFRTAEQTEPKTYCKKKNCVWWSTSFTECLAEKNGLKCKYKTEQTERSDDGNSKI